MSLSDNTSALQSLLAAVNELPTQTAVKLQEKSVIPSSSAITVVPDSGYDGLSKVNVAAAAAGVEVQVATGSITTDSSGRATVSCGFKPDLVVFHISSFTSNGEPYECVICLPIAASTNNSGANLDSMTWESSELTSFIECWVENITSTGVRVCFYRQSMSDFGYVSSKTYDWTAVKYTA